MKIAIYGAAGHTGRFILTELLRRGHAPIAIGRDESKLAAIPGVRERTVETRVASLDAPESLDRALSGVEAAIHCAGPFIDTAQPLIEAALRTRVHYLDLTAEQASAILTFSSFDAPARERGICVVPGAGFYGALGDVLATYAMGDWAQAGRIDIAIALDGWQPTRGTRLTGRRNTAARLNRSGGKLKPIELSAPAPWCFPQPFGTQDVVELPFAETIQMDRHLRVRDIRSYMNQAPLRDLRDPETPEPVAADERGRSNQNFLIEAVVRNGAEERHATARGRDIYAVSAPIVVEAAERLCRGRRGDGGAFALGELVDAADFLHTLARSGEIVVSPVSVRTR